VADLDMMIEVKVSFDEDREAAMEATGTGEPWH